MKKSISIFCCLILLSMCLLGCENPTEELIYRNCTKVFLEDNISSLEAVYIGREIEKLPNISQVTFISREDALEEYKEALGEETFEKMQGEDNQLPHSFEVVMEDLSLYDLTRDAILKIEGVDSVNSMFR